jgi:hypothetical protein
LRLQDATVLCVPGSTGVDFRLHTVYVPGRGLTSVEITDATGGEGLHRGSYEPNDIVVADQGLAHARSIHHVHRQGASTLVRAYLQNIRLHDLDGKRLEPGAVLQQADRGQRTWQVLVPLDGYEPVQARLIVMPLPAEKAARARNRRRYSRRHFDLPATSWCLPRSTHRIGALREGKRKRQDSLLLITQTHQRINAALSA